MLHLHEWHRLDEKWFIRRENRSIRWDDEIQALLWPRGTVAHDSRVPRELGGPRLTAIISHAVPLAVPLLCSQRRNRT